MKVYVSRAYLDWIESKRSEKKAIKAFERFLESIYNAKSVTEAPKPKKRDGGTAQGGNGGTVIAYEIARTYRLYANWLPSADGADVAFYAAVAMSKSNEKSQGDDIGKAIAMFKSFKSFNDADWQLWEPSTQQLNTPIESKFDKVIDVPDEPVEALNTKKKKGKPVDENGLTPKERKALRKKEQEEKRRQEKLAAEREQRAVAKKPEPANVRDVLSKTAEPDNVTEISVAPVADSVAADETTKPVSNRGIISAVADVPKVAPETTVAAPVADDTDDISDDEIRVVTQPAVTLNGTPVAEPLPVPNDAKFQNVMDVHYELEMIERQMRIQTLEIEIARHKIALEELAIKKLKLLQMQKMQDLQK